MAKKSKGLPFVVQPRLKPIIERLGSDVSGIIEIERKGYLTVSEKAIVQNSMKEDNGLGKAFVIARDIGSKEGLNAEQVFNDLGQEPQPEYLSKYPDEVAKIMGTMIAHEEKLKLVASTALILTRINPDWDPADTVDLHPDLQADLYKLYTEEDRKCLDALEEAVAALDDTQKESSGKE